MHATITINKSSWLSLTNYSNFEAAANYYCPIKYCMSMNIEQTVISFRVVAFTRYKVPHFTQINLSGEIGNM